MAEKKRSHHKKKPSTDKPTKKIPRQERLPGMENTKIAAIENTAFEAADSGVIDIRDVILPYVVTRDGRTLSEHLVPRMTELMSSDTSKLLTAGG